MTTPVPTRRKNEFLEMDYQWTPRQREVLWMLVKGHSNGRIAEELGVSLDGAKWHVREIMSKLGVDSREEAAEYWRAYNGLQLRFSRLFRAVIGGATLRWAGGLGAAAAVLAVGVLAVAVVVNFARERQAPEAGSPPPATASVAAPTPLATAGPGIVQPVTVRSLTLRDPVATVRDTVLFTATGCTSCDDPDGGLQRHVMLASGETVSTTLLATGQGPLEGLRIGEVGATPDGALLLVVACSSGYCGGQGNGAPPGTTWSILGSVDGGATWESLYVATARFVGLAAAARTGFIALSVGEGGADGAAYSLIGPDGTRRLEPPAGVDVSWSPILLSDGSVLWGPPGAERLVDESGASVALAVPSDATAVAANGFVALGDGGLAVTFRTAEPGKDVVQLYDAALAPVAAYATSPVSRMVGLSETLALANVPGDRVTGDPTTEYPALIDLRDGGITPITADVFTLEGGRNRLVALRTGTYAVVDADGDCLNVREEPGASAEVVACFADGTLMVDRGETASAGGITWLAVRTPDGREGWASTEFLRR